MTHDRIPFDEVRVTQEFISSLLGVRRERLTEAASALQKRNLIRYSRGHIQILDRVGLEAASCTCYGITKEAH
jgi:CRP-like cAMP-binding protein